jgi:hypothetical protein
METRQKCCFSFKFKPETFSNGNVPIYDCSESMQKRLGTHLLQNLKSIAVGFDKLSNSLKKRSKKK